jgi:chemotaxis protein CheD
MIVGRFPGPNSFRTVVTVLVVKVFGGADMFEAKTASKILTIGRQNLLARQGILLRNRLQVTAKDIGGGRGRKLFYYPHSGEVFVKRLGK